MTRVDTFAAEFESKALYMYNCYEDKCECEATTSLKPFILRGGPNSIGQGIECAYCCCDASFELREAGYDTIMAKFESKDKLHKL